MMFADCDLTGDSLVEPFAGTMISNHALGSF